MSTKSVPWSKWPAKWLKTLPNSVLGVSKGELLDFESGAFSKLGQTPSEGENPPKGAILRFVDFVERPLRSTSQRQEDERRGRSTDETGGGSGGDDGSPAPGTQP